MKVINKFSEFRPPFLGNKGKTKLVRCQNIYIVHSLSSGKVEMFLCAACHAFTPNVLNLLCYDLFDRFQRYVEIVRKSDEKR